MAHDTHNLAKFGGHLQANGGTARGQALVRNDGFDILKQMLERCYQEGDAAEASFPEYCQWSQPGDGDQEVASTFAEETGKGF